MAKSTESVKVVVRCRPLNSKEIVSSEKSCVVVNEKRNTIDIEKPNGEHKLFTFDQVFGDASHQMAVFDQVARPIIDSVVAGYNGTLFAYGQTGTGKTFTMEGDVDSKELRGIMPNTFEYVLQAISQCANNIEYLVRASFFEIYNDEVYDLLHKEKRVKMIVKEGKGGFYVKDLSTYACKSVNDIMRVLRHGQKSRMIGATSMNPGSSRSHSIFQVMVEACETDAENHQHYRMGKLSMVDLAGSERQKKTDATGERLNEAKNINLSLSALGNVINALVNPKAGHVPFRDSKLTRLLQDSLGGNTKTVMIANIGPAAYNFEETMSTLRYANRAKDIQNKPTINEDPKDTQLRAYQDEIEELRKQIQMRRGELGDGSMNETIIEKVIVKHEGLSSEELKELEAKDQAAKAEMEQHAEEEKQQILASKTEAEQAASTYEKELQAKERELLKERETIQQMESTLQDKSKKLLHGGKQIEQAMKRKQELEHTEQQLNEQRKKEAELAKHVEQAGDAELYMNEQFSTRQEELESKTKKLKQLWRKYKEKQADLKDLQDEFEIEREDLMENIRDSTRQLKLKTLVLQTCVSQRYIDLIESKAQWNEFAEEWRIPGALYGNAKSPHPREESNEPLHGNIDDLSDESDNSGDDNSSLRRQSPRRAEAAGRYYQVRPSTYDKIVDMVCNETQKFDPTRSASPASQMRERRRRIDRRDMSPEQQARIKRALERAQLIPCSDSVYFTYRSARHHD